MTYSHTVTLKSWLSINKRQDCLRLQVRVKLIIDYIVVIVKCLEPIRDFCSIMQHI